MLRSLPHPDGVEDVRTELAGHSLSAELVNPLAENSWDETTSLHRDATISAAAAASESYYGHFLDLKIGRDALISNFSSSVQRAVRKAQRSGLSVSMRSDKDAMATFYTLHVRTRRRHGVPPQPQSFFVN